MNNETVKKLQKYLKDNGIADIAATKSNVQLRAEGKSFSLSEHIEGMILSLLSSQGVWSDVERNLDRIAIIFDNYDAEKTKQHDSDFFTRELRKCRLRNRFLEIQMTAVKPNIERFELIEKAFGSVDAFVAGRPVSEVVKALSGSASPYKLKQMGVPLVCEYLRNVGVDTAKPDEHMRRMLGSERLGVSRKPIASETEVISAFYELSHETGILAADLDYLFWCYCATDKAQICSETPSCHKCVLRDECNYRGK